MRHAISKQFRFSRGYGIPITFRSPDDDEDDSDDDAKSEKDKGDAEEDGEGAKKKDKKADAGHIALRQQKDLARVIKGLREEFRELKEKVAARETPNGKAAKSEEEDKDEGDDGEHKGDRARLSKLEKEITKLSGKVEQAEKEKVELTTQLKQKDRRHTLESKLTELGAVKPAQVRSIIESDHLVEDKEIGDAVRVKTEHGEDLVPIVEWLPTFKEENPHLFAAPAKSGSGAGGGGADATKARFAQKDLADPRAGGMSWAQYEKDRDKIHAEFEERAQKK